MQTLKTILAVFVVMLAVLGIIVAGVGIYYSWALNTPVTDALVKTLTGVERVLTVADEGLTRVNSGLGTAINATSTIQGAVEAAGETIVETDIAYTILERTVGDTLFPKVVEAGETVNAVTATVVAFNETLEAANQLPFVELPTLTDELQTAADRIDQARTRVDEVRAEMQAIKENAVGRPVTAITSRTEPLIENLGEAQTSVTQAQSSVDQASQRVGTTKTTIPRAIDLISVGLTLALLWLILAQSCLIVRAWGYLRSHNA